MSNCGCPFCKKEKVPTTRAGWKSRKNKQGRIFGMGKRKGK